jgi:hypothetical protein
MTTATMKPSTTMMSGMGMGTTMPTMTPAMTGMMIPRCKMKLEKCTGGMKITCVCDDKMACSMLQNLCSMMANSKCSLCCMMNGAMVCCCNLTMGMCMCEMTADGVCVTCMSGDKACCDMIQACCECMTHMMKAGCTCCLMMNDMPVCCC